MSRPCLQRTESHQRGRIVRLSGDDALVLDPASSSRRPASSSTFARSSRTIGFAGSLATAARSSASGGVVLARGSRRCRRAACAHQSNAGIKDERGLSLAQGVVFLVQAYVADRHPLMGVRAGRDELEVAAILPDRAPIVAHAHESAAQHELREGVSADLSREHVTKDRKRIGESPVANGAVGCPQPVEERDHILGIAANLTGTAARRFSRSADVTQGGQPLLRVAVESFQPPSRPHDLPSACRARPSSLRPSAAGCCDTLCRSPGSLARSYSSGFGASMNFQRSSRRLLSGAQFR